MFAKAVVLVLALGGCGCTLLSMRQARLQAASELVRIQLNIRQQDEHLWKLRTRIAAAVTPDHVRSMAANIGPLRPLCPAMPGLTPEPRQFVDIAPAPLRSPTPVPAQSQIQFESQAQAQAKPKTPPGPAPTAKPRPEPKDQRTQTQRARLATLEPQR